MQLEHDYVSKYKNYYVFYLCFLEWVGEVLNWLLHLKLWPVLPAAGMWSIKWGIWKALLLHIVKGKLQVVV